MIIKWHGHSCFSIKSDKATVVIDPYGDIGLKKPKLSADILLISHRHDDHNNAKMVGPVKKEINLIQDAGEYEHLGVNIIAIPAWHDNKKGKERGETLLFTVRMEDMVVGHLGDLGQESLSGKQLEELNGIDILLIPVGGKYTINGEVASKIANQIDPRIVIPMHYKIEGLDIDLDDASSFIKEEGAKGVEPKPELKIEKRNLPTEERDVAILAPQH
jgi:L-ascorbate metabolism protein UlaG (beta-lactamase superfamily)